MNAAPMTADANNHDTGSWFPVPDESDLPDGLRGLFAKARERLGFVPLTTTTPYVIPAAGAR